MQYIELKEPGASVALLVQKVERRKSKFGEDYALIGNITPEVQASISVPEKAMERQMEKMLKISGADELKNRFVVVSRSDEPGPNGKLFWNVTWADEQTYAHTPDTSQTGAEAKRVQPPADTRTAAQRFDDAVPEGKPEPVQPRGSKPEPEEQQLPLGQGKTADELRDGVEAKKRANMIEVRRKMRALWEDEARFQLKLSADLEKEGLGTLTVDGSSVNAAVASQWITFDRRNYV